MVTRFNHLLLARLAINDHHRDGVLHMIGIIVSKQIEPGPLIILLLIRQSQDLFKLPFITWIKQGEVLIVPLLYDLCYDLTIIGLIIS